MTFSIYTLHSDGDASPCYFRVHQQRASFSSPFYRDQAAALQAIETWILRLRDRGGSDDYIAAAGDQYTLRLFGTSTSAVDESVEFTAYDTARQLLNKLHQAAGAKRFKLTFLELIDETATLTSLRELDLSTGEDRYAWREVGTSILKLEQGERKGTWVEPSMGLPPKLETGGPCAPIFSPLQPLLSVDMPLFHGRKKEVDDIYDLATRHRLVLFYGLARVGKTSLIQCGLANRLSAGSGELIVVSGQETHILSGLARAIRWEIEQGGGTVPADTQDPMRLLQQLQEQTDHPIFLVFDQLELLFQKRVTETERVAFFTFLQALVADDDSPYRIVLVMREAYLAPLADYEELLPPLLTNRYHLHPMRQDSMTDLTINLLDVLKGLGKVSVDDPAKLAESVCQRLANAQGQVPLACLQIYLHQLQQTACVETVSRPPVFDEALIERMGPAHAVIDDYVGMKIAALQAQFSPEDAAQNAALQQEVDELEQCRQQCGCSTSKAMVATAVAAPGVPPGRVRRLRWLLLLALLALLLSLIAYWLSYNWLQNQSPCAITETEDTCEAYVDYLCRYGETADCAQAFRAILEERQCAIWQDYQLLQNTPTCGAYQNFFARYRNSGVCTDFVSTRLLDWGCPVVRDTVELTRRDTVFAPLPSGFERASPRIPAVEPPSCQQIGGTNFKRVGPLWIMTKALSGGPYLWEDALDACTARGWRLPCIGEIDFLIENIYSDRADRAYQMLTGQGKCYLVNPSDITADRLDFWTATEANDAQAWSFYFDKATGTIGREPAMSKSARLPCLCVQKEESSQSGMPPCYQKNINRQTGQ